VVASVAAVAVLRRDGGAGQPDLPRVPEPVAVDLYGPRVLVLGDSLAMQAKRELRAFADLHRYRLEVSATSGHALRRPGAVGGRVAVHLRTGTEAEDVHFDCESPGYAIGDNEPCPLYPAGSYRYAYAIDALVRRIARP